jgi:glutamate dehydrogenase
VELVLEVYVGLSETLGLNVFSPQIASLAVGNYWQAMARETYIDDLEWQIRTLSVSLIGLMSEEQSVAEAIELWCKQHKVLLDRWHVMIADLKTAGKADYAMFSVALRELLDLAQASQHCTSFDVVDAECK